MKRKYFQITGIILIILAILIIIGWTQNINIPILSTPFVFMVILVLGIVLITDPHVKLF